MIDKRRIKFLFAPLGVAVGISAFILLFHRIVRTSGVPQPSHRVYIPRWIILAAGVLLIAFWIPVFIAGILALGRRGAVGQADGPVVKGIYKAVRNPIYSGVSFTIIGAGLCLNDAGVLLAGGFWFLLTFVQCLREEKELKVKYGRTYLDYQQSVPRFFPRLFMLQKN